MQFPPCLSVAPLEGVCGSSSYDAMSSIARSITSPPLETCTMFFVISGFLIAMILGRVEKLDVKSVCTFYYRRIKRILPLYYLVIACILIALFSLLPLTYLSMNIDSARRAIIFISNVKDAENPNEEYKKMRVETTEVAQGHEKKSFLACGIFRGDSGANSKPKANQITAEDLKKLLQVGLVRYWILPHLIVASHWKRMRSKRTEKAADLLTKRNELFLVRKAEITTDPILASFLKKKEKDERKKTKSKEGSGGHDFLVIGNSFACNQADMIFKAFGKYARRFNIHCRYICEVMVQTPNPACGTLLNLTAMIEELKPDVVFVIERSLQLKTGFNTRNPIDDDKTFKDLMERVTDLEERTKKIEADSMIASTSNQVYILQAIPSCKMEWLKIAHILQRPLKEMKEGLVTRDDFFARLRIHEVEKRCRTCEVIDYLPMLVDENGHYLGYNPDNNLVFIDYANHLTRPYVVVVAAAIILLRPWCHIKMGGQDGERRQHHRLQRRIRTSHAGTELFGEFTDVALSAEDVEPPIIELLESEEIFGSKSMNALKMIYKRCMDKGERVTARRLLEIIREYGVWPMVEGDDKWRVGDFDLTSLLAHVSEVRGLRTFISVGIHYDIKNSSRYVIAFDQGQLGLGQSTREIYLDKKKYGLMISTYKQFLINQMTRFLKDINLPKNDTKIADDVDEIIELEMKLAKVIVPDEDRRNYTKMYKLRRLSDMQRLMPLANWTRYFHSIAPRVVHDYFNGNPDIYIVETEFMRRVSALLKSTDPRVITNYVHLRYILSWDEQIGAQHDYISEEFHHAFDPNKQNRRAPTRKYCIARVMNMMKFAAGAIYVRKAFDQASKGVTLEMVEDMEEALRGMILTSDWMDTQTKAAMLHKAKQMLWMVAYPDVILDNEKLDGYYSGFSVKESDSFVRVWEKFLRWTIESSFKYLPMAVNRNEALNYGGIGSLIGHEIMHGFDDIGRRYDSVGNYQELWNADVEERFGERAQCIIDQYGKTEVQGTGLKINGKFTQGENIADNGAIKLAYRAWCQSVSERAKFSMVLTDPHSPPPYRVNLALANQPEFAAAFHCDVGTPMNPIERIVKLDAEAEDEPFELDDAF
ncbi:peptidase family M13 [Ancylostoma ceylanicum]|uniref:Peptidase family M13 n=1 Tax=Ancylostoma ceylanicum TaxID=53326 RepID=A0A0D6LUK3_9BILA|nr:peptidase family M13 [Ancylostoma ceylanicum]